MSLGCARNRVDSEVMLGLLWHDGWSFTENPEQASVIVVNTCSFIDPAKEESIEQILEAASYKERFPDLKLVVTGCLTQRYKEELVSELPEVDLFIGTDEFPKIAEFLRTLPAKGTVHADRTSYIYSHELPRINTQHPGSAYVKISEGCQHRCSFCVIPLIRGPLRSRSVESIHQEVLELVKTGVVEINLIAQDLTAFAREKSGSSESLPALIKSLASIKDLEWIRLLYAYPENIDNKLLTLLREEPKLVKYLDIPIQHASNKILKLMSRAIDQESLRNTIKKIRKTIPEIAIRTSVMVGFPGETEADFDELKQFVSDMHFEHLGCFVYSREEETRAAAMPDQIDDSTKNRRSNEIMKLQRAISKKYLKSFIGRTLPILVEGPHRETPLLWQGRLSTQAPEVDGVVIINEGNPIQGKIQSVRVTGTHDYDLVGTVENWHL